MVLAECDPSGGDVASWAQLRDSPGWSTAVASGDRSWDGLQTHLQQMPSGLNVLVAPTHTTQAQVVTREAAKRFGPLLRSMSDITVIADCGRMAGEVPSWALVADFVLLVVRQASSSEGATVAHGRPGRGVPGRAAGRSTDGRGGGDRCPSVLRPPSWRAAVHADVFAVLPEDPAGAALGGRGVDGRAGRCPLAAGPRRPPGGGATGRRRCRASARSCRSAETRARKRSGERVQRREDAGRERRRLEVVTGRPDRG